jgi:3-keto-L-gulonate-6-phosphate decarboxylase
MTLTDMFFVSAGADKSSVQYMAKTADVDNLSLQTDMSELKDWRAEAMNGKSIQCAVLICDQDHN